MKTKIVPFNYEDDMQNMMKDENCMVVGIEEMSITYTQLPDTNSSNDEYQHLTLATRMSCSVDKESTDKKEGFYFDVTIPDGEHWSIENGSELSAIVEDFKSRLYKTTEKK